MEVKEWARKAKAMVGSIRHPPWVPPGHFYSPIPSPSDLRRAKSVVAPTSVAGVDTDIVPQQELLKRLSQNWPQVPRAASPEWRYVPQNNMFGLVDAVIYASMLHDVRPTRVVEIGSGFSTALTLDIADRYLPELSLTCVEPYPDRLLALLRPGDRERIDLRRAPVQEMPLDLFSGLDGGDILFIDSTHVAKAGSDVMFLLLTVLPLLRHGVLVHVHDIFWPFEYPEAWLQENRAWNELYMLHAFLAYNDNFEIVLFESQLWIADASFRAEFRDALGPSGIWLRRTR